METQNTTKDNEAPAVLLPPLDLKKLMTEKVESILDEKLDSIITINAEKCIESMFKEMFGPYGHFHKNIEEQIKAGFSLNLDNVKIEMYNEKVIQIVNQEISKYLDSSVCTIVADRIKRECQILKKLDWKLSEIALEFAKTLDFDNSEYVEPTIIIENSDYGFTYIAFDEKRDKKRVNCEFELSLYKNKVSGFNIRGYNGTSDRSSMNKGINGRFDQLIFALYASAATIKIDSYQTEFYRGQD